MKMYLIHTLSCRVVILDLISPLIFKIGTTEILRLTS